MLPQRNRSCCSHRVFALSCLFIESSLERMRDCLYPKRMSMWFHERVSQREGGIAPTASQLVIPLDTGSILNMHLGVT